MTPALQHAPHAPAATRPVSSEEARGSYGSRLVAADGRELPLKGTRVVVDACAGYARVKLEQRFVNTFAEPLSVTYTLPLPADGAVAGFSFVLDGERTIGRIEKRADAREQFEQAVAEGRSAALLEQVRSSVFHQAIGNIPPGMELVIEVLVDQPLTWLVEGDWEWRWPQVVAPRYLAPQSAAEAAADARLDVEVYDGKLPATVQLALRIRDRVRPGEAPQSPSHTLSQARSGAEWLVSLSDEARDTLDRDLVVRWPVAAAQPGITLDVVRKTGTGVDVRGAAEMATGAAPHGLAANGDRVFGLLTIVPPATNSRFAVTARDLIVLMDTSGSMSGEPLDQAKRVVSALVRGLRPDDTLELLEFSNAVRHFDKKPLAMTEANRKNALDWIARLHAGGGTEMRTGIAAALAGVRADAQRQILLITDGQIGFEAQVIANIQRSLPASSRLHTLGVGSCVNRSLTGPAARAGRGSEHIVGLGEDVEPVLKRIVARLETPLVTDLSISGSAFRVSGCAGLPDLYAGAPALIPIELGQDHGHISVHGRTADGEWRMEIEVPPVREVSEAPAPAALFARERVEDLEMLRAAGKAAAAVDHEIELLGLSFHIATRLTSWVAVHERVTVDPTAPLRRVKQPQALPYGMSAEGLGLRAPAAVMIGAVAAAPMSVRASSPMPGAPMLGVRRRLRSEPAPPSPAPDAAAPKRAAGPPQEPAAPPPPAAPSAWQRLTRWIGGEGDEAAAQPVGDVRDEFGAFKEEEEASSLPVTLQGRVLLTKPDCLAIVVTLQGALEWERPERVSVVLDDGTELELEVDSARSTASGPLLSGHSLRLWLKLEAPLARDPVALRFGVVHVVLAK